MNNNGGFGNGNNAFWFIFLILLWGGNGFGGFGGNRNGTEFLANQINNDSTNIWVKFVNVLKK